MPRKKIGILTLPPISNYGGILQNYALQKVLTRFGYEPVTLERRFKGNPVFNFIFKIKNKTFNRLLGRYKYQFSESDKQYVYKAQFKFKESYINSSKLLFSSKDIYDFILQNDIRALIVGSDQVWRADYTPFIRDMFFCFLKDSKDYKRIAYAASFGHDSINYPIEDLTIIRSAIKKFDLITVREDSAISLCEREFGVLAQNVLDPTMLLSKQDYICELKLNENSLNNRGGLYYYLLDLNNKKENFLRQISSELNCEIYNRQPKNFSLNEGGSLDDKICPPIEEWLQGFLDAKFVITDSFHGTVFSILFEKPFFSIINRSKGASRFHSLLKMFDLENRLLDIADLDNFEFKNLSFDIDYSAINKKLEIEKTKSLSLLLEHLGD